MGDKAKVKVYFYLDADDYLILKKLAEEKRIPFSIMCRIIISDYLSQLKNGNRAVIG